MTEAEWLACTDPRPMLEFIGSQASGRQLRLFCCACARRAWPLLGDPRSRKAIELAELFADGGTDWRKLDGARRAAARAAGTDPSEEAARAAANAAEGHMRLVFVLAVARHAALAVEGEKKRRAEKRVQATLLRDVVRNPFAPSRPIEAAWLGWNDRIVPRLARAAYDERRLPDGTLDPARLGILADALLDAGCADEGLLAHLRSPGPHVRGCFAIDAILGKS